MQDQTKLCRSKQSLSCFNKRLPLAQRRRQLRRWVICEKQLPYNLCCGSGGIALGEASTYREACQAFCGFLQVPDNMSDTKPKPQDFINRRKSTDFLQCFMKANFTIIA